MSGSASSVAGAIGGGVICATLSHPLDTIKTCLQGDIARAKYSTVGQTAGALWAEGGGPPAALGLGLSHWTHDPSGLPRGQVPPSYQPRDVPAALQLDPSGS